MDKSNNIILIGMTLTGKTTLGKLISEKLNMSFLDTDKIIEEKVHLTVSDIFNKKGETFFREEEKKLLNNLKNIKNTVISTGGGVPVFNNNIEKLKHIGIVVYLKLDLDLIIERANKVSDRPLLKEQFNEKLIKMYNERKYIYEKSDLIIEIGNSIEENLSKIINVLKL